VTKSRGLRPIIREGGLYRERKIHQIDPQTGAILRTITSDRGFEHLIEPPDPLTTFLRQRFDEVWRNVEIYLKLDRVTSSLRPVEKRVGLRPRSAFEGSHSIGRELRKPRRESSRYSESVVYEGSSKRVQWEFKGRSGTPPDAG
jgi:hypothetical protein